MLIFPPFFHRLFHALFSWILISGLATFFFATPTSAAHVHYQNCYDQLKKPDDVTLHPPFLPDSLRAALKNQGDGSLLELQIVGGYPPELSCEEALDQISSAHLTLTTLGSSKRYLGKISGACGNATWRTQTPIEFTNLSISYEIDRPRSLVSFDLNVDLRGPHDLQIGCMNGFLTPEIEPVITATARWSPIAVFVLVILAATWREVYSLVAIATDQAEANYQSQGRAHLTRIADCLSWIQFIFFSGALSLIYPGFFRSVVSFSSWSTLMLPKGPVMRDSLYYGVKDGIYEVNGTFGGTNGLELMTQVIGAPVTVATWTNVVSLSLIILVVLTVIIQIGVRLTWTRDWFRSTNSWSIDGLGAHGRKATMWVVLQVFLSYFLMPITAWTTYQLDHASIRPLYYTFITTMVVCLVIAGCWWAMAERSPKSMGYLLIDGPEAKEMRPAVSRNQDFYAIATFILLFLRGLAIGGLQIVGVVQLLLLIGCDVIHLALSIWTRPGLPWLSRTSVLICARLCIWLLSAGMLPNTFAYGPRNALGYAILILHALVLVAVFLGPALHDVFTLALQTHRLKKPTVQTDEEERPQIYGLRQLSRRPNTMTNLSTRALWNFNTTTTPSESSSPSPISRPTSSMESTPQCPEEMRTYFRPPRSQSSSRDLSVGNQEWTVIRVSTPESSLASSTASVSEDSSPTLLVPSPVNPSVDYSFREADLYYGRPRRLSFRQTPAEDSGVQTRSPSLVNKLFGSIRRSS